MSDGTVYFAEHDGSCVLRFTGEIRYTLGHTLDSFLDRLFARGGFERVLIDLNDTEAIDSTGLGLLAKVANLERQRSGGKALLFSSRPDINELLSCLCLDEFFIFADGTAAEDTTPGAALADDGASPDELAHTILDAHRRLAAMNDNNRALFQNVVDELVRDLGQP